MIRENKSVWIDENGFRNVVLGDIDNTNKNLLADEQMLQSQLLSFLRRHRVGYKIADINRRFSEDALGVLKVVSYSCLLSLIKTTLDPIRTAWNPQYRIHNQAMSSTPEIDWGSRVS